MDNSHFNSVKQQGADLIDEGKQLPGCAHHGIYLPEQREALFKEKPVKDRRKDALDGLTAQGQEMGGYQ